MTYAMMSEAVSNKKSLASTRAFSGLHQSGGQHHGRWRTPSKEKQYVLNETRTLFQKNKNLSAPDLIKQCVDECTASIEIGLQYQILYPRSVHLSPMALTPQGGRRLQTQEKLRQLSKPVYLQSHVMKFPDGEDG